MILSKKEREQIEAAKAWVAELNETDQTHPTALDELEIMLALEEAGYKIPEEIAIKRYKESGLSKDETLKKIKENRK